jgi:PST family polysaccharide transporter
VGYGGVSIVAAVLGAGAWSLILGLLAQRLIGSGLAITIAKPALGFSFSRRHARDLLGYAGGMTVARFFTYMAKSADYFIIGRLLGIELVGFYERAYRLVSISQRRVTEVLDSVMFPVLSRVQDQMSTLRDAYCAMYAIVNVFMLPAAAIGIILAPEAVLVILGPKWGQAIPIFQILMASVSLQSGSRISDAIIRSTGHMTQFAAIKAIYAFAVIVGCLIGGTISLSAVAWFVVGAIVIHASSLALLVKNITNMRWLEIVRTHYGGAVLALAGGICAFGMAVLLRQLSAPAIVVLIVSFVPSALSVIGLLIWRPQLLGRPARQYLSWILDRFGPENWQAVHWYSDRMALTRDELNVDSVD